MAHTSSGKPRNNAVILIVILVLIALIGYDRLGAPGLRSDGTPTPSAARTPGQRETYPAAETSNEYEGEEEAGSGGLSAAVERTTRIDDPRIAQAALALHVLEVGKADSLLLVCGGEAMLIDAGHREDGDYVVSYLRDNGIAALKYAVGTHPHEDHIGGLAQVVQDVAIGEVLLSPRSHTTKTYERLLDAIEETDTSLSIPEPGTTLSLGGATIDVLSPLDEYENINDCSIALRVTYRGVALLLTGDVEKTAEADLIERYGDALRADVLKVPHHGSSTSSTKKFLARIQPSIAIVTCDERNPDEKPPYDSVLNRLRATADVYRTDESGVVVVLSDGNALDVITARVYDGLPLTSKHNDP